MQLNQCIDTGEFDCTLLLVMKPAHAGVDPGFSRNPTKLFYRGSRGAFVLPKSDNAKFVHKNIAIYRLIIVGLLCSSIHA